MIGKQWNIRLEVFGKPLQRWREVGADAVNLGVRFGEVCNTSLVLSEFLRSTTGEGGGKECEDHILFSALVRKFDLAAC